MKNKMLLPVDEKASQSLIEFQVELQTTSPLLELICFSSSFFTVANLYDQTDYCRLGSCHYQWVSAGRRVWVSPFLCLALKPIDQIQSGRGTKALR